MAWVNPKGRFSISIYQTVCKGNGKGNLPPIRRRKCRQRKQKIRYAWNNVSDGGGRGVFTGPGNWRQQWWSWRRNTGLRTQQRRRRRQRRTRNIRRVRGIRDNYGGGGGLAMGPRNIQWRRRRWRKKMRPKKTKTKMEAPAEDRRRVQGIGNNNWGIRGSEKGPMYWQRQQSVNFPCYRVANSNTVSSLSRCCLVLILFSSDSFIFSLLQERLSVLQSCRYYFCTKCTLALRMYPLRTGEYKKHKFSWSIKIYVSL